MTREELYSKFVGLYYAYSRLDVYDQNVTEQQNQLDNERIYIFDQARESG